MDWVALRVDVPSEAGEGVAAFLIEQGAAGVITEVHDVALPPPPPGRALLEAHLPASDRDRLRKALEAHLAVLGIADARIAATDVPAVDWEAVFREHHVPMTIGRRLLIAPPWDVPAAPGREVLVIEPGMAFGTGQHATTRGCLLEIEDAVMHGAVATGLDVGTGSGVLAAAMARLGVPYVVALDTDAAVVPLARANLARNGAAGVLLFTGGAGALRGRFDLVVANLLLDAIVAEASVLAALVAPGGRLVVSGLLDVQVAAVAAAFAGWRVHEAHREERWRTLRLVR